MIDDDIPRVSGALLINQRKVMTELAGADVVARVLAKLPQDLVCEYDSVTSLSWFPVSWSNTVVIAIADELGRNPLEFHCEVSRTSTERTFSTVWRLLLRFASPDAVIKRAPVIYSKSFTRGELSAKMPSPGRAELTLSGWPDIPDLQVRGLQVATANAFKVAGFKDVKVIGERRPPGAFYIATWRP